MDQRLTLFVLLLRRLVSIHTVQPRVYRANTCWRWRKQGQGLSMYQVADQTVIPGQRQDKAKSMLKLWPWGL